MTTITQEKVDSFQSSFDDLNHFICMECCGDGNIAVCGTDVSNHEWIDDQEDATCSICNEIYNCPKCGAEI